MTVYNQELISVSDSGALIVSDCQTGKQLLEVWPSHPDTYHLKAMTMLPDRNCFTVPDSNGQVHIFPMNANEALIKLDNSNETVSEVKHTAV